MVNRLVFPCILIPLLWVMVTGAAAAGTLSVEPDRKRLYQGEVLTLTVKGTMEIDINLSNLFDFDTSSLPTPDIAKVEDNFEILGRNQRYSIQTVNSQMKGEVTWTYQLAPRKSGQLTIPALQFRDATSRPVTIEVVDGNPPAQSGRVRDSFIELSTDKDTVYVQEQLVLSVKLFFNGNMIRGELSEPSHPNAIIESLGKQTEYTRFRDGVRYRVVERRYGVFPQQPGELRLPPIRFEGQARDASGRLKLLRDSKQLFTVPVRDIPANFTGRTWLPATELTLSESGLPNDPEIAAGQNLSRGLELVAEGLPAEALPPFTYELPDGLRAYPESPERTTVPTQQGLTARMTQTAALIPVATGKLTLPEIRIPWWDTTTDSQKMAIIPARTLQVKAISGQPETAGNQGGSAGQTAQAGPPPAPVETAAQPESTGLWLWQTIALMLLAAWLLTGFGWWYSGRAHVGTRKPVQQPEGKEKALFSTLCESALAGAPETPDHLIRWVQHLQPQRSIVGLEDVYRTLGSEVVDRKIRELQANAYSQRAGAAESWHGEPLIKALSQCREKMKLKPASTSPLPALYPDELSAR
jgi:hypothetical protein